MMSPVWQVTWETFLWTNRLDETRPIDADSHEVRGFQAFLLRAPQGSNLVP